MAVRTPVLGTKLRRAVVALRLAFAPVPVTHVGYTVDDDDASFVMYAWVADAALPVQLPLDPEQLPVKLAVIVVPEIPT